MQYKCLYSDSEGKQTNLWSWFLPCIACNTFSALNVQLTFEQMPKSSVVKLLKNCSTEILSLWINIQSLLYYGPVKVLFWENIYYNSSPEGSTFLRCCPGFGPQGPRIMSLFCSALFLHLVSFKKHKFLVWLETPQLCCSIQLTKQFV